MDQQLPNTTTSPNPNGKKILCIEDEHFISELYVRALSKVGYQVTVEVDGARGLALAQSDQFDIILLDLMIPTMSGTEVLTKLRDPALTPHFHAKIIITTNLEQREDVRANIERQADGYIIKATITPRELVDILNRIKL
jgi:CheY-like chemotaxis protein